MNKNTWWFVAGVSITLLFAWILKIATPKSTWEQAIEDKKAYGVVFIVFDPNAEHTYEYVGTYGQYGETSVAIYRTEEDAKRVYKRIRDQVRP